MKKFLKGILLIVLMVICLSLTQASVGQAMNEELYGDGGSLPLYAEEDDTYEDSPLKPENSDCTLKPFLQKAESYLKAKQVSKALAILEEAQELFPKSKAAPIYMGYAHNVNEEYVKAIQIWKSVIEKDSQSYIADVLFKQITIAMYRDGKKQAKETVKKKTPQSAAESEMLAVVLFGDEGLTKKNIHLHKAFTALVISDLKRIDSLKVLDRIRLQTIWNELQLRTNGTVEKRDALQVGRLLGASKIATVNLTLSDNDKMNAHYSLMDTTTGIEFGKESKKGILNEFYILQKEIVTDIIRDMKIPLTTMEEEFIGRYPTRSLQEIYSYEKALNAQDCGDWDKAIAILQKSSDNDPTGPWALALREAPSGEDAEASISIETMGIIVDEALKADAKTAGIPGS